MFARDKLVVLCHAVGGGGSWHLAPASNGVDKCICLPPIFLPCLCKSQMVIRQEQSGKRLLSVCICLP
jgi:hypothetical protein